MGEPSEIGSWRKISILGSGGFGVVSLWGQNNTDEYIAIKKCKWNDGSKLSTRQKERWIHEVQIMKNLNHPNIVAHKNLPEEMLKVLAKHNTTKLPLLSMEYCRKGNLRHSLLLPANSCGLSESSVYDVLNDISSAVRYLHTYNITHRDIKPDNIVMQDCTTRKENITYKLIDLGYAKELNDSNVSFVGTLYYLAPEIFSGQKYDSSVDYWSFGILAFEVICGVLPFPPYLTIPERYKYIKQKGLNDICIYQPYLGDIKYSTKLFKENKINSCLQENIEIWLRHVLQFHPSNRSKPFANNIGIFDYLQNIFKKKIVNVFSVYKYEFYSYEYDEFTLMSTLRHWIARDTKILEDEQVVLSSLSFNGCDNTTLVKDCVTTDNPIVYIFKPGHLFNIEDKLLPKKVRLIFEKPTERYKWHEMKQIFAHSIFYVSEDMKHADAFYNALTLYFKKVVANFGDLESSKNVINKDLIRLVMKLECFNKTKEAQTETSMDLDQKAKIKECILKYQRIVASVERCFFNEKEFSRRSKTFVGKIEFLKKLLPDICDFVKLPELERNKNAINVLMQKGISAGGNTQEPFCKDLAKILSNTIKLKDKLWNSKDVSKYLVLMGHVSKNIDNLVRWGKDFARHIDELSKVLNGIEKEYCLLHQSKTKNVKLQTLDNGKVNFELGPLIEENQNLRLRFQNVLDESISHHQNYDYQANLYLNTIV